MYSAAVPIQADARAAMLALSSALASRKPTAQRSQGEMRVRDVLARNAAKMTDLEKQHARVWKILRSALPADAIVMGDATQIVYTGSFAMPMEMERCWYYSGTYCSLGVALPMAIGAKIGAPHRPVIAVAGDGGIMFTVNELATAAEERLALPVIVWNNDALKGSWTRWTGGRFRASAWSPRARTSCDWRRASAVMPLAPRAPNIWRNRCAMRSSPIVRR